MVDGGQLLERAVGPSCLDLLRGRRPLDEARRVIDWLERGGAGLPCRWPRIAVATGLALLAEAGGDFGTAQRLHQAALTLHEGVDMPVEHVETLLGYGAFLRRRGQPARARSCRHAIA